MIHKRHNRELLTIELLSEHIPYNIRYFQRWDEFLQDFDLSRSVNSTIQFSKGITKVTKNQFPQTTVKQKLFISITEGKYNLYKSTFIAKDTIRL